MASVEDTSSQTGISLQEYGVLRSGAGLLDRRDRGRLLLTGADRRSYLQGLLTNDIEALTPGRGCYAAYLTAQGRMIADMRVLELGDAILLDTPGPVAAILRDRLDQFIFSEDVKVADISERRAHFGLYGPHAAAVLAAAFDAAQDRNALESMEMFASTRRDFGGAPVIVARSDDYGVAGFEVFPDAEHAADFVAAVRMAGALDVSRAAADITRIEAGRPAFGVDMDEDTIPLEAGIEDRAISLTKGCYVGQEIIIRVLHRGHGRVARRLVTVRVDGDVVPAHGDPIRSGDRDIGRVTSAVFSPQHAGPLALGYVHRDFTSGGTAVTIEHGGVALGATVHVRPTTG